MSPMLHKDSSTKSTPPFQVSTRTLPFSFLSADSAMSAVERNDLSVKLCIVAETVV